MKNLDKHFTTTLGMTTDMPIVPSEFNFDANENLSSLMQTIRPTYEQLAEVARRIIKEKIDVQE